MSEKNNAGERLAKAYFSVPLAYGWLQLKMVVVLTTKATP